MEKGNTYTSKSLDDTRLLAERFVDNLFTKGGKTGGKAVIIFLQGDLGSGKTTFVKAIADILEVKETVTSPTFVIEKVYKIHSSGAKKAGFHELVHIDAYRLGGGGDLQTIRWGEVVDNPKNLVFMEWPEMVHETIPENSQLIRFRFVDENTREITF
jgi:tRNA threonylcarbamoyladenosine biosynthesis protein TsaE